MKDIENVYEKQDRFNIREVFENKNELILYRGANLPPDVKYTLENSKTCYF